MTGSAGDREAARLTWKRFLEGLCADADFRRRWNDTIRNCPHAAVYWETAAVSAAALEQPFASVLLEAGSLARARADWAPFAEHLRGVALVTSFENLGRDATLVVPAPTGDYPHLAAFARTAPAEQVDALWREVGEAMRARLARSTRPVWLSTAGDGVSWLHVRLDDRPKYYHHAPFRVSPQAS